jgi:hypothetical protein
VFTARYALSPYIRQIGFVFKGLMVVGFLLRRLLKRIDGSLYVAVAMYMVRRKGDGAKYRCFALGGGGCCNPIERDRSQDLNNDLHVDVMQGEIIFHPCSALEDIWSTRRCPICGFVQAVWCRPFVRI